MKRWNLVIDVEKCEDCNNCFLACKDEHIDNEFPGYAISQPRHGHRWIDILRKERGQYPVVDVAYLPVPCYHCDEAPCVKAAQDGAVCKRDDGIVIIDPLKAKGQKSIVDSCPFGAVWWNEEQQVPQKCTFCAHLLDEGWKEPRCVTACPTGALTAVCVADGEMEKISQQENLRFYQQKGSVKPRVHYKNLYRYTQSFICGSVTHTIGAVTDCVESADVILLETSGSEITRTITDCFGDFKFDHLEADGRTYQLNIVHGKLGTKSLEVKLNDSLFVGVIQL